MSIADNQISSYAKTLTGEGFWLGRPDKISVLFTMKMKHRRF